MFPIEVVEVPKVGDVAGRCEYSISIFLLPQVVHVESHASVDEIVLVLTESGSGEVDGTIPYEVEVVLLDRVAKCGNDLPSDPCNSDTTVH